MMTKARADIVTDTRKTGFVDFEDGNVFPSFRRFAVKHSCRYPCDHIGATRFGQNLTINFF